jgi:hypothetical protein
MTSDTRLFLAVLSAFGLTASIVAYGGSYVGMSMDSLSFWAIMLHIGAIFLIVPMYLANLSGIKDRTFSWKVFAQEMPRWVVPSIKLLGLFSALHFILFLIQSHAASPQIKNGEYVLNNHSQIVKVITQREYLMLKGAELRLFATGWMFCYFVETMFWWFPRRVKTS